jgi:hypothetical protein
MLKGHHGAIEHFRDMEKAIAHDLNNWLCNIYIEIRHLPLAVVETKNQVNYNFIDKKLDVVTTESKNAYLNKVLLFNNAGDRKSVKNAKSIKVVTYSKKADGNDIEAGRGEADGDGNDAAGKGVQSNGGQPFHGLFNRHKSGTQAEKKADKVEEGPKDDHKAEGRYSSIDG